MSVDKFRTSFQRLREKWPFTIEFEREVWIKTRALNEEQFDALCKALSEREFPPGINDFSSHIPVVNTPLHREPERVPHVPVLDTIYQACQMCDSGVVFAEQVRTKAIYLFKCTCALGSRVRQSLPDWRYDLIEVFTPTKKK